MPKGKLAGVTPMLKQASPINDVFEDRERFRLEIHEQLNKRLKKHQFQTKRTASDYVQGRVSEQEVYKQQVSSQDNAIENIEFDRAAFNQMKSELEERKAAKTQLVSGGLP